MGNHVLFEIGVEELPARFIDEAENQLFAKTKDWLKKSRIDYGEIITYSTPRRLAVVIKSIAKEQTTIKEEVRGPSVNIAKDENGEWTKAAIGFTKGQGKTVDDIYFKNVGETPYVFVTKEIKGRPTKDILPSFKNIVTSIQFPQSMRWGSESIAYARPIRWLVALYNQDIIPFKIANVETSNITYGHRFLGDHITINDPREYEQTLAEQYVIVDKEKREQHILKGVQKIEDEQNVYTMIDKQLLREVCHLVEYPTVFLGTFDQSFLSLPQEVLITSMKEHQRYFPVTDKNGKLLSYFIGVRNGNSDHIETVIRGNERVLYARLADAEFFYEEDQKLTIDDYLKKLERVVFHEKLGTIHEKVNRVWRLTKYLTKALQCDDETTKHALRAATICKFDLSSQMVNEFPELQGIMGEKYARNFNEHEEVAKAVYEHYLPKHANDTLPTSMIGALIGLADKIDTIVGCISVGIMPTGSRDPYGLRRQTIAILKTLLDMRLNLPLESLIDASFDIYVDNGIIENVSDDLKHDIFTFFKGRAIYLLGEDDIEQDIIDAVLYEEIGSFAYAVDKAKLLAKRRHDENYKSTQEALTRILNMAKSIGQAYCHIDSTLFKTSSERQLYEQYLTITEQIQEASDAKDAEKMLRAIECLATPIHTFFEYNMVMDSDETIKNNRLALVHHVAEAIFKFADLTRIQWKQHF